MTLFRFVHAADLHLDSPFTGLKTAAPEGVAATLYDATFRAYENLIDLCIDERVDALLVAGDIYDGADRSFRAQHKFIAGLERLDAEGIRSFVCHGNHDPLDGWEARLDYPPGCHRFGAEFEPVPVFPDDPERAVVYGVSYPTRDVYDNLALRLGRVQPGPYSVGLMHANVDGNPNHGLYAPCSLADLAESGVDYWALGHVHTRQILNQSRPTVVYPGNTQGRHINETGARGAYLVEVDDGGGANLSFRALDVVRWERLEVDISTCEDEQELLDAIHDGMQLLQDDADDRHVVTRLSLTGRGELNRSLKAPGVLDDVVVQVNEEWTSRTPFAWCERAEDMTASPFDRAARLRGADFLAETLKTADRALDDDDLMERLRGGLSDLYQHRRYRRYISDTAPTDDELVALISEAEALVVDLIAGDDE